MKLVHVTSSKPSSHVAVSDFCFQGRDTPSPVDTPYLCRQRNNIGATQLGRGQVSEIIERGALLASTNHIHEAEAATTVDTLNI